MKAITRIFLIVSLLVTQAACRNEGDLPISFIIPDGFSGPIMLVRNPGETRKPIQTKDEYIIEVPSSGIVFIDPERVLGRWHTSTVRHRDGTAVPKMYPFVEPKPSCGFILGPTSVTGNDERVIWWAFVGAYHDAKSLFEGPDSNEMMRKEEERIQK